MSLSHSLYWLSPRYQKSFSIFLFTSSLPEIHFVTTQAYRKIKEQSTSLFRAGAVLYPKNTKETITPKNHLDLSIDPKCSPLWMGLSWEHGVTVPHTVWEQLIS